MLVFFAAMCEVSKKKYIFDVKISLTGVTSNVALLFF